MIKQKETIRIYNFSDADLKQIADSIIIAARRDITEFNQRGVTTANLDALQAESEAFADIPTDEELVGSQIAATDARNDVRNRVTLKVIEIRNMVEVKWGVKSAQYRTYDFQDLSKQTINDFFRTAKRVLRVANTQQADLASEGLTPLKLTELTNTIAELDVKIDEQTDAERSRNMAAHDRVLAGNALYTQVDRLASIGKNIWVSINEAKYNDYVLDNYLQEGPSLTVLSNTEGNIAAGALLDLGLLPAGAKVIRLINTSNVILEIGLGINASGFDGNTSTLNGNGTIEVNIEAFSSTGNIVLLRNQSTAQTGSYQVQVLG